MRYRSPQSATLQRVLDRFRRVVVTGGRALAFWASVLLPVGYALVVLAPSVDPGLVAPLAAVHVCSLVVGHAYGQRRVERPSTPGGGP